MQWQRDKRKESVDYIPDRIRFETLRDIVAVVFALALIAVSIRWALPRYLIPEGESLTISAKVEELGALVDEETTSSNGSGRFQPTTLPDDYVFVGSLSATQAAEVTDSDYTILLGQRNIRADAFESILRIDLAEIDSPPPLVFDEKTALPFEEIVIGESSGKFLAALDQPFDLLTWTTSSGRTVYVRSRGVSLADLVTVAEGLIIFEPFVAEVSEDAAEEDTTTSQQLSDVAGVTARATFTAGMTVILSETLNSLESQVTIDTFAVPGTTARPVIVTSLRPRRDFYPELDAIDEKVRLLPVRDTEAVFSDTGLLRWREQDGLILELSAEGYSRSELVQMANELRELSIDQLNSRVRPVVDIDETVIATPSPTPSFDDSGLGAIYGLEQPVGELRPPVNGQLSGAIVALGRLEGSDIDAFYWRRSDSDIAYCVGIAGADAKAVFCVLDEDLSQPLARMGSFDVLEGAFAGQRIHVWRVPVASAVVTFNIAGESRRQYPQEGIVAFLAPLGEYVSVKAYDSEGTRI